MLWAVGITYVAVMTLFALAFCKVAARADADMEEAVRKHRAALKEARDLLAKVA